AYHEDTKDTKFFDQSLRALRGFSCLRDTYSQKTPDADYQSSRTVRPIVRGWMVPADRLLPPDDTYFPVVALLFTELFGPVKTNAASSVVNCTSLNTLYAWSCSLIPEFFRPPIEIGKRRESVRSHSCQVGLRRIPTG